MIIDVRLYADNYPLLIKTLAEAKDFTVIKEGNVTIGVIMRPTSARELLLRRMKVQLEDIEASIQEPIVSNRGD